MSTMPSSSSPDHRASHEEDRDNSMLVFTVDVKANKHQFKQGLKKLYNIDVEKAVTNLFRH